MTAEDRKKYDAELSNATWVVPTRGEQPRPQPRRRRVPSWWKGDEGAVASSLQAARQLGLKPTG